MRIKPLAIILVSLVSIVLFAIFLRNFSRSITKHSQFEYQQLGANEFRESECSFSVLMPMKFGRIILEWSMPLNPVEVGRHELSDEETITLVAKNTSNADIDFNLLSSVPSSNAAFDVIMSHRTAPGGEVVLYSGGIRSFFLSTHFSFVVILGGRKVYQFAI